MEKDAFNSLDMALFEVKRGLDDLSKIIQYLDTEAAKELQNDLIDVKKAAIDLDEKLRKVREAK